MHKWIVWHKPPTNETLVPVRIAVLADRCDIINGVLVFYSKSEYSGVQTVTRAFPPDRWKGCELEEGA